MFIHFLSFFQGMSVKYAVCGTCNKGLENCPSHFGYIDLECFSCWIFQSYHYYLAKVLLMCSFVC